MSARFGRNQRRKLREALAAETVRRERAEAERNRANIALRRLESDMDEWAGRIAALLGPKSAFAREMIEEGIDARWFEDLTSGGLPMMLDPHRPFVGFSSMPPANMAHKLIEAFAITANAETDDLDRRVRFIIRGPDGARAMMCDQRTLYDLRRGPGDMELKRWLLERLVAPWMRDAKGGA